MIKFLKNLFKIGKKKSKKMTISEDGMLIEIDMVAGNMVITTDKELTDSQIKEIFKKYMKGM